MSELDVLWYKNISRICGFLALILLLVIEFCEMVICTWNLFENLSSLLPQVPPVSSDIRRPLVWTVWLIKLVWNFIFVWIMIKCCVGIRKKQPHRLKPFLVALILTMIGIVIRLIFWAFFQDKVNDLVTTFNTNLYWLAMNLKRQTPHLDQVVLCNLFQIGVGCCFFVVIYFNYEVLRYEAIRRQYEEIVGNVVPLNMIRVKAKPNEYVKCHPQGTNKPVETSS